MLIFLLFSKVPSMSLTFFSLLNSLILQLGQLNLDSIVEILMDPVLHIEFAHTEAHEPGVDRRNLAHHITEYIGIEFKIFYIFL